jgi:hypothetical protein
MTAWRHSRNYERQMIASHWAGKNGFGTRRGAGIRINHIVGYSINSTLSTSL